MSVTPYVVAVLSVVVFATVFWRLRVLDTLNSLTSHTVSGVSAMFDSSLDEDQQEQAVRQAGFTLLKVAWQILWRFGLILVAAAVPVYLADALGIVTISESLDVLLSVNFIVIVSVLAIALSWVASRRVRSDVTDSTGAAEQDSGNKLIHTLAFASPSVLKLSSRLDDRLSAKKLSRVNSAPPIFITSLARGGTTAILNALHGLPQVATHCYRDMPFVTAPVLWSRLGGKTRTVEKRQRAHGDGLEISLDSPEAFDEVLWMLHWPEKYANLKIELWNTADARDDAKEDMVRHFKKIILLRRPAAATGTGGNIRYLSKNNANISRLRLLPHMFPGCDIVVPVRHPSAHAASLLRQHQNFTSLHAQDPFALRYMRDIGHFEFGALHRPIGFDTFSTGGLKPEEPDYWLAYWISAFKEVTTHLHRVHLVFQDDLRAAPKEAMKILTDKLDLRVDDDFASYFRPTPDARPTDMFSTQLMHEAEGIYDVLISSQNYSASEVDRQPESPLLEYGE